MLFKIEHVIEKERKIPLFKISIFFPFLSDFKGVAYRAEFGWSEKFQNTLKMGWKRRLRLVFDVADSKSRFSRSVGPRLHPILEDSCFYQHLIVFLILSEIQFSVLTLSLLTPQGGYVADIGLFFDDFFFIFEFVCCIRLLFKISESFAL